jgi:hypothetical protein
MNEAYDPYEFEPEYDKYAGLEMWFQCPKCKKAFEVDEPDDYCEHYKENYDE